MLNLSAPVAREVAGEKRLQFHNQRELVTAGQFLASHVGADLDALAQRDSHYRTSIGRGKVTFSVRVVRVSTSVAPRPRTAWTTRSTKWGGDEAAAVTPTVRTGRNQSARSCVSSSMRTARQPARSDTSTSRAALDELEEPTTSMRSHSAAMARTAS